MMVKEQEVPKVVGAAVPPAEAPVVIKPKERVIRPIAD